MSLILSMEKREQEEAEGDAKLVASRPLGIVQFVYQEQPKELGIAKIHPAYRRINAMCKEKSALLYQDQVLG